MQGNNNSMSNIPNNSDVSLSGIYFFLREFWKLMLSCAMVGLTWALIYTFLFSPRFEGVGLINMAHFIDNETYPPSITSIEEPSELIYRFKSADAKIPECNSQGNLKAKLILMPGSESTKSVDLRVSGDDSGLISGCSNAIYDWVVASQSLIADSKIRMAKTQLALINERISQNNYFLSKLESSKFFPSESISALLTQKRVMEDEAQKLHKFVFDFKLVATKFLIPIEVRSSQSFLKYIKNISAGLSGGVFIGLFLSLMIRMFRQLKLEFAHLLKR